jgi:hypothetical protein
MGDRISISFKDDSEESVVFFEHWAGLRLKKDVEAFVKEINTKYVKNQNDPYTRREPSRIMPLFIAWYFKKHNGGDSVYLGATDEDGDNSDNGHYTYDLQKDTWSHIKGEYE